MPDTLTVPAAGALDLLSLGALVHRLDTGVVPFRKATECRIHVSGGEFNVAANLSDCCGLARGQETIRRIMQFVDVLVGNEEDMQKGLGIPGPEVVAESKLDPSAFFAMIDRVVKQHPGVKVVATTLREVHSTNRHSWSAVAWVGGQSYVAPTCELDVYDRVGGGDG